RLVNANPYLTTPWNGVGIFHEDIAGAYGDRAYQINYTLMSLGSPAAPRLLDPEYTGTRVIGSDGKPVALDITDATTRTYIGKNAGYSYADLKDFFLAAYSPATGEVLVPSFHRDWLTGGPNSLAPSSDFWKNPNNKLKTLRPWPDDHPQFPRVS